MEISTRYQRRMEKVRTLGKRSANGFIVQKSPKKRAETKKVGEKEERKRKTEREKKKGKKKRKKREREKNGKSQTFIKVCTGGAGGVSTARYF
jgi:hypothetical protein